MACIYKAVPIENMHISFSVCVPVIQEQNETKVMWQLFIITEAMPWLSSTYEEDIFVWML